MFITFTTVNKKRFFKTKQVWVADVRLTNCSNINEENSLFVGYLTVTKLKYETILTIHLDEKKHSLHRQCTGKWTYDLSFNKKEDADKILSTITSDLKVQLKENQKAN